MSVRLGYRCAPAQERAALRLSPPGPFRPATQWTLRQAHRCPRAAPSTAAQVSPEPRTGLFPAGKQQAKVKLPAVFLRLEAADVDSLADVLDPALAAGLSAVVLVDSASGGGDLFMAASRVLEHLRGRAMLLVEDRPDIAAAVQMDGVLLTGRGMPTTAARMVLPDGRFLVGRVVSTPAEAATAASDGASFLVMAPPPGQALTLDLLRETTQQQRSGLNVPLLVDADAIATSDDTTVRALFAGAALSGVSGSGGALACFGGPGSPGEGAAEGGARLAGGVATLVDLIQHGDEGIATAGRAAAPPVSDKPALLSQLLKPQENSVLQDVKQVMDRISAFLASAVPEMGEARLLRDAVVALDAPFLVVVVGEFNSGKSSLVNALLGRRALKEGILPTTNEISVLQHSPDGESTVKRMEDGLYVQSLPCELLRRVNIVDTPGTNVILGRQQRLTEEFVPRADLVLFIMSADRPFTDSEVQFLRYIKQWGKKIVFVLNKVDIFDSVDDVDQVREFVMDNARTLLGGDSASVLTVSARLALAAKLACGSEDSGGVLSTLDVTDTLEQDPRWAASSFASLEEFMFDFLTGGGKGESTRLKLQTPVCVALALLEAAQVQLDAELAVAEQEVAAVRAVATQVAKFRRGMDDDSATQRASVRSALQVAASRSSAAISDLLQLRNLGSLSGYVLGDASANTADSPIVTALSLALSAAKIEEIPDRVRAHATWLDANAVRQLQTYRTFVGQRSSSAASELPTAAPEASISSQDSDDEDAGSSRDMQAAAKSIALAKAINVESLAAQIEGEVREVVMGTSTSVAGAATAGTVLATVLPTTLEDLLALALTSSLVYMSVLNLPLKRADVKASVQRRYTGLSDDLEGEMMRELAVRLDQLQADVGAMVAPVEQQAVADVAAVKQQLEVLAELQRELDDIQTETARL